ncbi:MAG: aldo/keto reductase [Verrucomicrobiota bacterium]
MVPKVSLSSNGPDFSRIVFGTWRVLDDPVTRDVEGLHERLRVCEEVGITTVDTAEIYGLYRVEEALGAALARDPSLRQRLQLVSKSGIYVPCEFHPDRKTAFYNATAARIVKSAEKSLRFLGTDYLDLLLVHRPDWLASVDETAEGLNKLLKEGKIRSAGVSNYSVSQFDALNSRMIQPLVTNQVEFSLLHMAPMDDGVFDHAQQHRYRPMAWSPLAGARLWDTAHEPSRRLQAVCAEISEKYGGATLDQLAYAWVLAHPARALPVIGTHKIERIKAAASAVELQLEREDWYALWTAAKGHPIP